jgi:adenylate cyclase
VSEATGERFYAAELWRLKGVVRGAQHSVAEAERCFREAIAIARHQQARLFELRSAISLCGVLEHIDRAVAVREILQPLLDGFSEGAAARDVLAARSLAAGATAAGR